MNQPLSLIAAGLTDPGVQRQNNEDTWGEPPPNLTPELAAAKGNKSQAARTRALDGFKRGRFRVLVATILSARTRDDVTSKASRRLFKEAPDVSALARLSQERIRELIRPVGFFNTKAKHLKRLPEALRPYGYRVPDELDQLLKLPGVGRKTANLVLSVAFDKPAICVDTHVHRIMNIWEFVDTKTPEATEKALRNILPVKYWSRMNSIIVAFGQERCKPIGPQCDCCLFEQDCPKNGVTPKHKTHKRADTLKLKGSAILSDIFGSDHCPVQMELFGAIDR